MEYFHVAPAGLAPRSIIVPGSWGQQIRRFATNERAIERHSDAIILMWECALEAVRRVKKRKAPSRLSCVFACLTLEDAVAFRDKFRQGSSVYKVVATDRKTRIFIADYEVISGDTTGAHADRISVDTISYWIRKPRGMREVLIDGDVRILALVAT